MVHLRLEIRFVALVAALLVGGCGGGASPKVTGDGGPPDGAPDGAAGAAGGTAGAAGGTAGTGGDTAGAGGSGGDTTDGGSDAPADAGDDAAPSTDAADGGSVDLGSDAASDVAADAPPSTDTADGAPADVGDAGTGDAPAEASTDGAGEAGGSPPSAFRCSDLGSLDPGATSRTCFDFTDPSQGSSWMSDGGTWTVVNGQYVGTGPSAPVTCPDMGSMITASLVDNFSAANVRVHVQMTSVDRADKVIVLRSRDSGNRIELNFIANYEYDGAQLGGVMALQEIVNCVYTPLSPATVPVPHDIGDTLTVDLDLRGTQLTVKVDGSQVFDGALAIATDPGGVGLGVITGETVRFDDFWVEALN